MNTLTFLHASMQFSDTAEQAAHDTDVILGMDADIVTFTESNEAKVINGWKAAARRYGYRLHCPRSTGVAVKRDLVDGRWRRGYEHVLDAGESKTGNHTNRGVAWVQFDNDELGRIGVAAGHYVTKGRPVRGLYGTNVELNRRYARAIGRWAREFGKGSALAFYGGDQNIVDRTDDTFFGEDLTSSWDELNHWMNTGHGNIDVIASYDRDGRVKARSVRSFDDSKVRLFTDHFLVESVFEVRPRRRSVRRSRV